MGKWVSVGKLVKVSQCWVSELVGVGIWVSIRKEESIQFSRLKYKWLRE